MAKTIAQLEAELKELEAKQREEKGALKAKLARAQRAEFEALGKALVEAGFTGKPKDVAFLLDAARKAKDAGLLKKPADAPTVTAPKPAAPTAPTPKPAPVQPPRPNVFSGALPKKN